MAKKTVKRGKKLQSKSLPKVKTLTLTAPAPHRPKI